MNYRQLGNTGWQISEVSLGTWQLGGGWGDPFNHSSAEKTIHAAIDSGINFIDTADVYSDGLSEAAVGRVVRERKEQVFVATKCGRRISPHVNSGYTVDRLRKFVEDSLRNMKIDSIDLIQLHCPPTEVYYRPEIFGLFDELKKEGKIKNLGVSVEKVEEAIKAIEYPNVSTVQIIFNLFRQRPSELFFKLAKEKNIGIIVRVPLASGLLSGKFTRETTFGERDHRFFNRSGAAFDKGETFAGIDYELGLEAVDELKQAFEDNAPLALLAIRWILMFQEVSAVIPGASTYRQALDNVKASEMPPLSIGQMQAVQKIYDKKIKPSVHHLW